jgi:hypothetical protein
MKEKEILVEYLPEAMIDPVFAWVVRHQIYLKITRSRASKLGDYRPPGNKQAYHRITINHDLNPYAFFITFVHELAHLLTHKQYGTMVQAHGKEWKANYRKLMKPFLEKNVFPPNLQRTVYQHLRNIKASSQADVELTRTLMLFDGGRRETLIEDLHPGDRFLFRNNREFQVVEKLRKRYKCIELDSKRIFLFQPLTVVEMVSGE